VTVNTVYVFITEVLQCIGVQCMCDGRGAPSRGQLTLGSPTFELSERDSMVGLPFLEMGLHVMQGIDITFLLLLKAKIERLCPIRARVG